MVLCVFCRSEVTRSLKEWDYRKRYYHVKKYKCPKCGGAFRAYFHDNEFSHTIPRYVGTKKKILNFLRKHPNSTQNDIADALGLGPDEVLSELLELEKEGRVRAKQ